MLFRSPPLSHTANRTLANIYTLSPCAYPLYITAKCLQLISQRDDDGIVGGVEDQPFSHIQDGCIAASKELQRERERER